MTTTQTEGSLPEVEIERPECYDEAELSAQHGGPRQALPPTVEPQVLVPLDGRQPALRWCVVVRQTGPLVQSFTPNPRHC